MPNYIQRGRIQLHYLDKKGERISTPILVYAVNAILPEKELMNLGMKTVALMPQKFLKSRRFVTQARNDFWAGKAKSFYSPYNKISLEGSNPGSAAIAQAFNRYLNTDYDGIYIIKPKNYDKTKKYPVVFYCHGKLGNWELYNGLWCRLKDCIVVSIGTKNLSGIFSKSDIDKVFTKYLPYIESIGYHIDKKQIHLMGLSNGGSAANIAFSLYSGQLKSVVYMSARCDIIKYANTKVLMIAGGKDESSATLPNAHKKLKALGTPTSMLYYPDGNHYIIWLTCKLPCKNLT